ncbi:MAG: Gfo/Idh/MocA family oxidoreductase [Helicobacter sp.]|nr:Gfo/Idh/MocA family oxidoreductase [Helicobacter sp.]
MPLEPLESAKNTKNIERIKVAQIGYGYWGRNVLKALLSFPHIEVVLFDIEKSQICNIQDNRVTICNNFEEILNDISIEAIFIITPPKSHFNLAKSALLANKHIFVEKPLSTDLAKSQELFELAKKMQKILHVDHVFLYSSAVNWLKNNINTLGEIIYINARRLNLGLFQSDVDVFWDLGLHDLSIIDYLFGLDIKNLNVFSKKLAKYPRSALSSIYFELDNIFVSIETSWLSPIKVRKMTFGGSQKTAIYDETKSQKVTIFDSGVIINTENKQSLYQKMVQYRNGDISHPQILQPMPPLNASISDFLHKIKLDISINLEHENHVLRVMSALQKISDLAL